MTKIYQALEQANRDRSKEDHRAEAVAVVPPQPKVQGPTSFEMSARIEGLYHAVCSMLPSDRGRIIEFISPHRGAGVTTLISEFAQIADRSFGRSVLVLDAEGHAGSICGQFGLKPSIGLHEVLNDNLPLEDALVHSGMSHIYLGVLSTTGTPHARIESPAFQDAMDRFRADFDFVLIEAPPALESPVGAALGRIADGILLVLEAEKTRWQVAENVQEILKNGGGNVLGVVLNKRRYHVPNFIYQRL